MWLLGVFVAEPLARWRWRRSFLFLPTLSLSLSLSPAPPPGFPIRAPGGKPLGRRRLGRRPSGVEGVYKEEEEEEENKETVRRRRSV